jgi:hypothetical protein
MKAECLSSKPERRDHRSRTAAALFVCASRTAAIAATFAGSLPASVSSYDCRT